MMTPVPDRKQKWIGLSFGIVVTLLTVHFLINPKPDTQEPFYALDAWAYDRLLIKRNALQSVSDKNLPEIFIITCDEASFSSLQLLDDPRSAQWPWSPALFAQVVNRLDRLGAAVIGIDKLFVEPHLLNELDRPGRLEAQLADACAKHGKTVLASKFEAVRFDEFSEASTIVKPLKILQDASAFGFISLPLDPDGSIRRASSRIQHQERSYDSFASEIVRLYRQTNPSALSSFHHNTFYIAYDGKPFDSFPFFLFVDGLYEQFSDTFFGDNEDDDGFASFDINRFKNSIVLIGATAGELHDVYKSPISVQPIPGVEIHANIVKTLLSENFLNPVGDRLQRWMVLILTAAICILYSFVSIRVGLLGSFIGVVGWIAGGSFALLYGGTVVRIVTPAVCLGLAPIASFAFRYFSELRTLADYLEKRVEERTAQLETANHELKKSQLQLIQSEKMASLGQLVAGIAHEINNPINFNVSYM